jgi:hypothetical protein
VSGLGLGLAGCELRGEERRGQAHPYISLRLTVGCVGRVLQHARAGQLVQCQPLQPPACPGGQGPEVQVLECLTKEGQTQAAVGTATNQAFWEPSLPVYLPNHTGALACLFGQLEKTWGFPSQFINQPTGYGHTTRATPGVSLPSGSRTRNLQILDLVYKPPRCLGDDY